MNDALIIFDIDGTLLQSESVTVPAVQRTLTEYGLAVPGTATISAFFGRPVEEYHAWLRRQCPAGRESEIVSEVDRRELELIGTDGRLYPGVREVLAGLKQDGAALAISSNGPDDYVNEVLDAHDLRRFFEVIRFRGTKYAGKVEMVGEILALVPARPAVVVGDRKDDIESAHRHRTLAVGAAYGFGGEGELSQADAVVHAAAEIPEALQQLLQRPDGKAPSPAASRPW